MAGFAWAGAIAAALMFFVTGDQLAARRRAARSSPTSASARRWSSTTRSCARSPTADERDRVSSRGWALGYLGGGLLLAVNLGVVTLHDAFGLGTGMAVRVCMLLGGALVGRRSR